MGGIAEQRHQQKHMKTGNRNNTERKLYGALTAVMGLILLLSCTGQALAQNSKDVVVTLKAQKVLQSGGKEVLKVAERAFPGEIIQYDALYKTKARAAFTICSRHCPSLRGWNICLKRRSRLPPRRAHGKNSEPIPLMRQVTLADGATKQEPVPYSEYRALRWELGISIQEKRREFPQERAWHSSNRPTILLPNEL